LNIVFNLNWEPVSGAISYTVSSMDEDGDETVLTSTAATEYDTLVDESTSSVFVIRAFDGANYGPATYITYQAPVTLGDLRDQIRARLKDTDEENPRVSDDDLAQFIRDAIEDYGFRFPRAGEVTIECEEDVREYDLPTGTVSVKTVKYTDANGNRFDLTYKPWKGGDSELVSTSSSIGSKLGIYHRTSSRLYPGNYDFVDGRIELDFDPDGDGDTLTIRYGGAYSMPLYDPMPLDVPSSDTELIRLYACGLATVGTENQDANLRRWFEEGRRNDNPITPVTNRYFNAYFQRVRDRQNKPRRLRRVRA
jgi:hypothetical protein